MERLAQPARDRGRDVPPRRRQNRQSRPSKAGWRSSSETPPRLEQRKESFPAGTMPEYPPTSPSATSPCCCSSPQVEDSLLQLGLFPRNPAAHRIRRALRDGPDGRKNARRRPRSGRRVRQKLEDKKFAEDQQARLQFFYQKTPTSTTATSSIRSPGSRKLADPRCGFSSGAERSTILQRRKETNRGLPAIREQILNDLDRLTPDEQRRAAAMVHLLLLPLPPGTPGKALLRFAGADRSGVCPRE